MSLFDFMSNVRAASAVTSVVPQTPAFRAVDIVVPSRPEVPTAMPSGLAAQILEQTGGPPAMQEMKRITSLETYSPMTPEEVDRVSQMFVLGSAYAAGFRLRRSQAEGIIAYLNFGGVFGKIGVGDGKTLLSLMVLNAAERAGRRNPLLSIPSHVFMQLWKTDIRVTRTRVQFPDRVHTFVGLTRQQRLALAKSGKKGVYIITHSLLSQPDAHEILAALAPETVVLDEAHAFANARAARTRRMVQTLSPEEAAQPVQVVALSGTMTKKTVMDYHHLAKLTLGPNCPLPLQASLAIEWGLLIDAAVDPGAAVKAGPLRPLVVWARENFKDQQHLLADDVLGFRRAFRLRMDSTPGVVTSDDTNIGSSLTIENQPASEQGAAGEEFDRLQQHISDVENLWMAPNGDEIEFAVHKHKWLFELSAGFFNQLVWPDVEKFAKSRRLSAAAAEALLEDAKLAHEARNLLSKEIRGWLEANAHDGMDTPLLLMQSMARHGARDVSIELYSAWTNWHALTKPEHPEREEKPIRVCDYKIQEAVKWATAQVAQGDGGIIWSYHREMNEWVFERMVAAGLDAVHCVASERIDSMLADPDQHPALRKKILCASIASHGEGKNLQFMDRCFVMQWMRSAKVCEQLLGRLHRPGQQADEVMVTTCNTLDWDHQNMAACIIDSLYIHQTSGRQKMIYCGWNPLPPMYPPAALRQRGFENTLLDAEGQKLLADKFGG